MLRADLWQKIQDFSVRLRKLRFVADFPLIFLMGVGGGGTTFPNKNNVWSSEKMEVSPIVVTFQKQNPFILGERVYNCGFLEVFDTCC